MSNLRRPLSTEKKITPKTISVIKVIAFLVVLVMVTNGVLNILSFKYGDGILSIDIFYDQKPNTVDVLVLGSSHAFENINTSVLYTEYGIASFDLCGSVQPFWNTYYYLEEALKTQSPKLVVLEAYGVNIVDEYSDDSRIIKNNYGLRWSSTKINSLSVSVPQDRLKDFIIGPFQYHSRYASLTKEDFEPHLGMKIFENFKGFGCNYATTAFETPKVSHITETMELYWKTERYYRKIIELCIDKGIPLLIVVTPYVVTESEQMRYNKAAVIAEEYSVPFINYNLQYKELRFDFSKDMAEIGHNNHIGNIKTTRAIGELLKQNYDLPDRRNNPNWKSWELDAQFFWQGLKNQKLRDTIEWNGYYSQLMNSDYFIAVTTKGDMSLSVQTINGFLQSFGIENEYYDSNGAWVMKNREIIFNKYEKMNHPFIRLGSICLDFSREDGIYIGNDNISKVANGINIIVYDAITDSIVDIIGLDVTDILTIKR